MSYIYAKQNNKKWAVYSAKEHKFIELNLSWAELGKFHKQHDGVALSQCVSEDKKNWSWDSLLIEVKHYHGENELLRIKQKINQK